MLALGAIAIPFQIFSGDLRARSLADLQPAKLAAMKGVFHTQKGAPIKIGGIVDVKMGQVLSVSPITTRAREWRSLGS